MKAVFKYSYNETLDNVTVKFPQEPGILNQTAQNPDRCEISGSREGLDQTEVHVWVSKMRGLLEFGKDVEFVSHADTVDLQFHPYHVGVASTVNPIMKFFEYDHLPESLQVVSKRMGEIAYYMDRSLPECDEKHAGLRKLLEAKDCMIRALLEQNQS